MKESGDCAAKAVAELIAGREPAGFVPAAFLPARFARVRPA